MPRPLRYWTQYPVAHIDLAKHVAQATLPARYGPFSQKAASAFRASFYRFREALRISPDRTPNSYPGRFYEMLEALSAEIESAAASSDERYVVFDLDEMTKQMDKLDPAGAQRRELARNHFLRLQKPPDPQPTVSEPLFTEEQMERQKEIISKYNRVSDKQQGAQDGTTKPEMIAFLRAHPKYDSLLDVYRRQIESGIIDEVVLKSLYEKHQNGSKSNEKTLTTSH